jgi:outer membrane protein OmpA-like peptidoglycan-associated protein
MYARTRIRGRALHRVMSAAIVVVVSGTASVAAQAADTASARSAVEAPPRSALERAQEAYARAARSESRTLRPDLLLSARRALDHAEALEADAPGSDHAEHAAYLARRRAQLAEVGASAAAAEQRRRQAEADYLGMHELLLTMSTAALGMLEAAYLEVQAELEQTAMALVQVASQLEHAASDNRTLKAREAQLRRHRDALMGELAGRERMLVAEREARRDAEARLSAAAGEIARVRGGEPEARIVLGAARLFREGQGTLAKEASTELEPVVAALDREPASHRFEVLVFADVAGDAASLDLARARAMALRDHLVARGIDPARVVAEGRGQGATEAPGSPKGRVEIRIRGAEEAATLEGRD